MNLLRFVSRLVSMPVLALLVMQPARAGWLESSVALDRVYIPALAISSAAQTDPAAQGRAVAAFDRLQSRWPALRSELLPQLSAGGPKHASAARSTLARVDAHIAVARRAVSAGNFQVAHETLEAVRVDLMEARRARSMDYFVDRLTAYHEPMEVLALAGKDWAPQTLTAQRREDLERAFAHARALWQQVEQNPPASPGYGLDAERAARLHRAMAEEAAALAQLSDALREGDAAKLLKAAAAIKPPFARAFTTFGQPD